MYRNENTRHKKIQKHGGQRDGENLPRTWPHAWSNVNVHYFRWKYFCFSFYYNVLASIVLENLENCANVKLVVPDSRRKLTPLSPEVRAWGALVWLTYPLISIPHMAITSVKGRSCHLLNTNRNTRIHVELWRRNIQSITFTNKRDKY